MRRIIHILVFILFISIKLLGQMPAKIFNPVTKSPFQNNNKITKPGSIILAEDCLNNIDDDGNGLIDMKDFSCYFANTSPDTCMPSRIVWASYSSQLYWMDPDTNDDGLINFPANETYYDIAWTPNGKLYGCETLSKTIREIDPNTGQTQFAANMPGYVFTNGMTSDAEGYLYITSFTNSNNCHVLKLNIITNEITIIADLTAYNLTSAGDLSFLNGYLYISCAANQIAKVDISSRTVQAITYTGNGPSGSFGITTLGDGFLYLCSADELYQLDPNTWISSFYYKAPTFGIMFGLTSYAEFCNAPAVCRANVNITAESTVPYCSNTGVLLKGTGTGISSAGSYTWITPEGQRIFTDTMRAFTSGRYFLRYHTLPDTCGIDASIDINIITFPAVLLAGDTVLCTGAQLTLVPATSEGITSCLWQDGSNAMQYTATQSGYYWVDVSNVCGTARDSIIITGGLFPQVGLTSDTSVCTLSSIILRNCFLKQPGETYTWSTGSGNDSIIITQPGSYWLQSVNGCGTMVDHMVVSMKDSCYCNPFFLAAVDLGADKEFCKYDTLILFNRLHKPGFRYLWQDGSTARSFNVRQPGIYWADITTYCNTIRDIVIVKEKSGCSCDIYLPNAFTPNNDGKNEKYTPLSNCAFTGEIKIFNRWGNLVYTTNNLQKAGMDIL